MKYSVRLCTFILFTYLSFLCFDLSAQEIEQRHIALDRLRELQKDIDLKRKAEIVRFATDNNIPTSYLDSNGNIVLLYSFDETGLPMFKTVDNSGAAITTNVNNVQIGGNMGLNLTGDGITVGVWDGGLVNPHLEFSDRLMSTQGANLSNHATHVTGTIIAKGNNPSARGMAPKASALTWDFDNDESEMLSVVKPDESSLLISNHSYGLITGWRFDNSWTWYGNTSISSAEDYRFGYYSQGARLWDEIAFNAPYYTICKSAGNDRTDTGNGVYPPDCNGGDGYDCISDVAVAKNIITVGAVNKIPTYVDNSSVVMSSFSSWGPTDDGRIKPDIVGAGVNIFSTGSNGPTNYNSLSGTSMATPNVTGSLVLLQELHRDLTGRLMKSSTLKAVAIHSTREAGLHPGPDYKFGWGLLDVEQASRVIINSRNRNDVIIHEGSLHQGSEFVIPIDPVLGSKVKVTLVWTDPPGTVVPPALDPVDLNLVNDLDLRLITPDEIVYPWTLNPASPNDPATKGDNFRDNVEKLELDNAEAESYSIVVKHKGALFGGVQNFSLIAEYLSRDDSKKTFYWIGGSGDWNDPSHWSLSSGGTAYGLIPTAFDNVIFDGNSLGVNNTATVSFSSNAVCGSLISFTDNLGFNLNSNSLEVSSDFLLTRNINFEDSNDGEIFFKGDQDEVDIMLNDSDLSNVRLIFDGNGSTWNISGSKVIGEINIKRGTLKIVDQDFELHSLIADPDGQLSVVIQNSTLRNLNFSVANGYNLSIDQSSSIIVNLPNSNETAEIIWDGINFNGDLIISSNANILGNSIYGKVVIAASHVKLLNSNTFNTLELSNGSSINIIPESTQIIKDDLIISSSATKRVSIIGGDNTYLNIQSRRKFCFEFLDIQSVNLIGDAVIGVGLSSTLVDSDNWIMGTCESILFSDFEVKYNCANGLSEFRSLSGGDIDGYEWNFGDGSSSLISENGDTVYSYLNEGTYNVSLTISNDAYTNTFERAIDIIPNSLPQNHIVLSNNTLFSFRSALEYQWYFNNARIDGAKERGYRFTGQSGIYFVVTKNNECTRISTPFIVTSVEQPNSVTLDLKIFPNPADTELNIEVPLEFQDSRIAIIDSFGRTIASVQPKGNIITFDTSNYVSGLYILQFINGSSRFQRKILIRH